MATENAISLRSGKFCAHTYVYRLLGVSDSDAYRDVISGEYFYGMIRASLGLYNTKDEADIFLNELDLIYFFAKIYMLFIFFLLKSYSSNMFSNSS